MLGWDFQNKLKSAWTGRITFVLEVPLGYFASRHNLFVYFCERCSSTIHFFRKRAPVYDVLGGLVEFDARYLESFLLVDGTIRSSKRPPKTAVFESFN